ncbi:VOC family protein [Rubinisphaera margarita]|uniref:VOC family protein n=1 Tax=Rubinisphaera margarita TaxID=2909586 RepID=UPI001EE89582|nr:VOC family protein [Rubinisphaera margarita]MCG6158278.1 VOC family protein [Rubinisphaera margarita]
MSQTLIQPYLFFGGRCEEALEFYKQAIEAEIEMLLRFNESPESPPEGTLQPGFEEKVMHASFRVGKNRIMASDGCEASSGFAGFSLSLALPTKAEVDRAFAGLSEGGQVTMPLGKTFWSSHFGMVTDKFGIGWMVALLEEPPASFD